MFIVQYRRPDNVRFQTKLGPGHRPLRFTTAEAAWDFVKTELAPALPNSTKYDVSAEDPPYDRDEAEPRSQLSRIDPRGCACTDCIVGRSVPLDQASDTDVKQMLGMVAGPALGNATGYSRSDFRIEVRIVRPDASGGDRR